VEIIYERVAGIDVGKKIIAVAVRTPGARAGKRGKSCASSTPITGR
jgi:transposase